MDDDPIGPDLAARSYIGYADDGRVEHDAHRAGGVPHWHPFDGETLGPPVPWNRSARRGVA
jgi:hypothetical protein